MAMAYGGELLSNIKNLIFVSRSEQDGIPYANTSEIETQAEPSAAAAAYPGILDYDLTTLNSGQRCAFAVTVIILCVLSMCGNVSTLYVNFRRKIRPFYRACLIALAVSDLLSTAFMSLAYLSQFTTAYVQMWRLGCMMCGFVPFITTAAILASSMTLVGIALDRYFAVMETPIGCWNPGAIFSAICMAVIWAISVGIASPMCTSYKLFWVYILSGANVNLSIKTGHEVLSPSYLLEEESELVAMCVSDKESIALYYVIVLGIIFVPTLLAFLWLNSIIAKKLWIRRHREDFKREQKDATRTFASTCKKNKKTSNAECDGGKGEDEMKRSQLPTGNCQQIRNHTNWRSSSNLTISSGMVATSACCNPPSVKEHQAKPVHGTSSSARALRHLRMFTVILLLMTVFIFFRLPAWIFLIMRMHGTYTKRDHWILHFCFGILNLTSCVLNPLFYTFLPETIQCTMLIKTKLIDDVCGLRVCLMRRRRRYDQAAKQSPNNHDNTTWWRGMSHCCCIKCIENSNQEPPSTVRIFQIE